MKNCNIDFGDGVDQKKTMVGRKSISILLGAGFSAPMGYPVGDDMNDSVSDFDNRCVDFSPSGKLAISKDGKKTEFQMEGILNEHQKYFIFCKLLIKEYSKAHNNRFDYELFYDFIKSDEAKAERYRALCRDLLTENDTYENYLFNIRHIYNQMIAYLLKDGNGKSNYDDEPYQMNDFNGYDNKLDKINDIDDKPKQFKDLDSYNQFLKILSQLSEKFIINVHTLNHDLLFESFNKKEALVDKSSDGFDEFGSEYYGQLKQGNITYNCRLERYTGRYNTPVRLFKLHGSLDYVPFYRRTVNNIMIPDKYVKIKSGISAGDIIKSCKSKMKYDASPFEYHADFLTGTTSKIKRYNEPILFKKLFKKFEKNLRQAEKLIIIGYGCKDEGINDIIKEHFDYKHKPSFIIDKHAGEVVEKFGKDINAVLKKIDINDIKSDLFT